ncbi:MAG: 1-acyl-sn-glycerol-3-phosphate acyltransferase [bacterium]|nr:1-acyl-sn-glycerol-3-phosphate acyltransferase [bacterium]
MRRIKDIIVSGVIWFLFALTFIFWTFVLLITSIFSTGRPFEKVGKLLCRSLLMVGGIRVKTRGLENIGPGKQYIVMMNHINLFDPFIFYGRFSGRSVAFQEEEHFKKPLYGWIMRKMGHIPITRKSPRKAVEDLKKGPEFLNKNKEFSIIIFPEGTRSATGKLGNFKRGAFLMTLDSGLDILPVIQLGGYKVKKKNSRIVRPGKMELIFEKPIPTAGYTRENVPELMKQLRELFLKYVD